MMEVFLPAQEFGIEDILIPTTTKEMDNISVSLLNMPKMIVELALLCRLSERIKSYTKETVECYKRSPHTGDQEQLAVFYLLVKYYYALIRVTFGRDIPYVKS
jgi:hypothetical protein